MRPGQHEDRTESTHAAALCPEPLDYQAAVAEFDLLWETCAGCRQPGRMRQLLKIIDALEGAPAARTG
ncbi:hypothetical protein ACHAC9_02865 [Massilia sp. CMS3.1]|uniref:hypothetical protein n=1 Tax=Massilia sp. CMS3.1 TaxID=3373083 RepID=UPI003EE5D5BE